MKKSVIYLILFLIFLYFMIDIAEAACNPYTFIGGSISPSNVNTGGSYTISCDYGALIDCIVSQPGSGTCSFTGFSGSTATFSCVAGSTSGTFTGYCSTYNGFNSVSNCCGSTNSVGTLTVTSGATTTCSSLGGTCKSNSCSSYSLCSSVSGATDCSNCCYGSCTSGATTTGPYTISGRVKTSGGVGISDTQIFLNSDYNCMSYTYLPNMITGPSGDYSFTISPSDDLYKEQNGQLSLAIWYGNCDYTYDSICKPLGTVTSNTGVDFIGTLQPVYSVSGYVKYSDNTPIANAQVHLSKGCFTQPITDVYTNSQGYYSYTVYHDSTITCTYSTMCIQTGGETYGPVTFNGNIQHNFIISGTSPTTTCSSQGGTCKYPSCDSYESCNPITGTTGCSSGYLCCSGACTTPSPTTTCSSLGGTCKSSLCSNYNSCSLVSGATDCTYGYSCCSGTCTSGASTTIRGYAKTSTGTGISGVSVTASCQSFVGPFPAPIYATTSSSGYYSLTIPANWISHPCTADLYASQSGCTFSPSGYSVTLTGGTVNKDFTGTCTSTSVCTDSDNGLNYDILGTTYGIQNWVPFSQSTTTDYCWGVKDVIEFYCMNTTTYSWTNHSCPSSCSNGVCLGGSNFYNISGQVKYSNGTRISCPISDPCLKNCVGDCNTCTGWGLWTTDINGYYSYQVQSGINLCVAAQNSKYSFSPQNYQLTVTSDLSGKDFIGIKAGPCTGSCLSNLCSSYSSCSSLTGTCSTGFCCTGSCTTQSQIGAYNISGYTLPNTNIEAKIGSCPGNSLLNTYTTNSQGYYFISSNNQQLCLIPGKLGYTFVPLSYSASLTLTSTQQNFTGTSSPLCSLSDAYFAKSPDDNIIITSAIEGDSVNLIVKGNPNCNGKAISFTIKEYDPIGSDSPVSINPQPVNFSNGQAKAPWIAEWQDDGLLGGDPEYYFTAYEGASNSITSGTTNDRLLSVSKSGTPGTCGNGAINSGEECDGSNLNSSTCSSLGWDSGILKCDASCHFDFSSCYDTTTCGDGTCQEQESCLTCPSDCGICSNNQTSCGDNVCDHKSPSNEYCNNCEQDCGPCIGGPCDDDNHKDQGEECDGTDLNGVTQCKNIDQHYVSGTLTCNNCLYNETNCKTSSQCAYDCSANNLCEGNCIFSSKCTEDPDCKCSDYVEFGYSECTKDECLDGWDTSVYKNHGTSSGCCALPDCYPSQCYSAWECSDWGPCENGKKTRTCDLKGTLPQDCPQYSPDTQKTCLTEAEFPFFSPTQIVYVILLLIAFYGYKLKRKKKR